MRLHQALAYVFLLPAAILASAFAIYTATRYSDIVERTTVIDEQVTIVTLDEFVIVMQHASRPRLTRVRPAVVPTPKDVPAKLPAAKWTLPFSCGEARYYSANFTHDQLDAMRKAAGAPLPTVDQWKQIRACLGGRAA